VFFYAGEHGALFYDECPSFSAFTLNAWNGFFFGFIHICLMILVWDALRRGMIRRLAVPISTHLLAATATIMNDVDNGCWISLSMLLLLSMSCAANVRWVITQTDYASRKRL